jgi:tRNA-2-methylthio-N6-dimethylallyladenosine synthase/ribosomal protein S12 methylthiotransferase
VTPELLRCIRSCGAPLLPYLDIPLQHAHPEVLRRMGRPFAGDPRRVLDRVRAELPEAALRTTFIVGYPGETEAQFESLCRFVEESRFQHVGVFAYQAEEGTAAAALPDQAPDEVKQRRRNTLMELQADISEQLLASRVGGRMQVLVDAPHPDWPGLHSGRVWFQAPEVDGITYVSGPGVLPGALVECDIVENTAYDLTALA